MVSYISEAATRKSGTFTAYNEDGSILSDVRFESAECMQLDQKGELEEGRRQLTKTMTVRFSTKTLAINGITVFGELEADRRAGVTPTVREVAEEKKVTEVYITDAQGNKQPKYKEGDTIYANVISVGKVGDTIDIRFPDKTKDFKYQGTILPNDTISNYTIQSNSDRIALEVVAQQNTKSQDGTK